MGRHWELGLARFLRAGVPDLQAPARFGRRAFCVLWGGGMQIGHQTLIGPIMLSGSRMGESRAAPDIIQIQIVGVDH